MTTLARLQLFLYIFSVCIGRRNNEEKGVLAARKATSLLLCSRAECDQKAEEGDPYLHSIGNMSGILGPVLGSPGETQTNWRESKQGTGKLEAVGQDGQGAGAHDLGEKP